MRKKTVPANFQKVPKGITRPLRRVLTKVPDIRDLQWFAAENKPCFCVYVYVDPRTKVPKYVGMTGNIESRHQNHTGKAPTNRANADYLAWRQSLDAVNKTPLLDTLYIYPCEQQAAMKERELVQTYEAQGIRLTNITYTARDARPGNHMAGVLMPFSCRSRCRYPHVTEQPA